MDSLGDFIGRAIGRMRPGWFGRFFRRGRSTSYATFDHATKEDFDRYVNLRKDTPTKRVILDILARDFSTPFSLLDVGCGPGLIAAMLALRPDLERLVSYTGIDQSATAIEYCQKTFDPARTSFFQVDVLRGLPPPRWDVVIVNELVEHLPSYDILNEAFKAAIKVVVVTTFAVRPDLRKDVIKFLPAAGCYVNAYAFAPFYDFLRGHTASRSGTMSLMDLGDYHPANRSTTYRRKTDMVFYCALDSSLFADMSAHRKKIAPGLAVDASAANSET